MNVIAVISDSFRRDNIGAFGNSWFKTPNLDRFASQPTVFSQYRIASYAKIPNRKRDVFKKNPQVAKRLQTSLAKEPIGLASPEDFGAKINNKMR